MLEHVVPEFHRSKTITATLYNNQNYHPHMHQRFGSSNKLAKVTVRCFRQLYPWNNNNNEKHNYYSVIDINQSVMSLDGMLLSENTHNNNTCPYAMLAYAILSGTIKKT